MVIVRDHEHVVLFNVFAVHPFLASGVNALHKAMSLHSHEHSDVRHAKLEGDASLAFTANQKSGAIKEVKHRTDVFWLVFS
jgi:hypothetical protein